MDGSTFGPPRAELEAARTTDRDGPLPEREWGLSAWQVVAVVLTILAVCEVIGALG